MLSMDLTSSGLAAGTWDEGSCCGFGAACGCGVAAGAVEDCAAALKLKSVNHTASEKSLNFMVRTPVQD
jgi:hypothetical protein